jgi:hypothetical protein
MANVEIFRKNYYTRAVSYLSNLAIMTLSNNIKLRNDGYP